MPAPGFGYSVGDVIAVTNLAWKLYKRCKEAPQSYYNISQELISLHAVLKECEEVFPETKYGTGNKRVARLRVILDGCQEVLEELDGITSKFESLGMQQKRTWDRMRWHSNDIGEIRARMTSHVSMLSAFLSTSQARVEQKLEALLREFQRGNMEGSVISNLTVDSLSTQQAFQWRTVRKEFEEHNITVEMFHANKDFILQWFINTIATGALEEQSNDQGTTASLPLEESAQHTLYPPQFPDPVIKSRSSSSALQHIQSPHKIEAEELNTASTDGARQGAVVVKTGFLTKRGKNFGGWKARYFVLDSPELRYYGNPGGLQLGTIKLSNASIGRQITDPSDAAGRNEYRHALLIQEQREDSKSFFRHVLCAENDAERDQWITALLHYVEAEGSK